MAHRQNQGPNYFVAFQITDKDIVTNLKSMQSTILERHPQYEPFIIAENGFHLTLSVLELRDSTDISRCVETMDKMQPELIDLASKTGNLNFVGLGTFSNNVIFASVRHSPAFLDLVNTISEGLADAGIIVHERASGFTPHLTLFKGFRSAVRGMPEEVNTCAEGFGSQAIDNIQVCRMNTLPESCVNARFYRSIFKLII